MGAKSHPRIVVGIDGSEGSRHALRWAIDEARRRNAVVEAVAVWETPYTLVGGETFPVDDHPVMQHARAVLDDALGSLDAGETTQVEIAREVIEGVPAEALCRVAEHADLLVLGARGHSRLGGLLLGSVVDRVAHHAPCPLVIVPRR